MVQELGNLTFDITYKHILPEGNDTVLAIVGNTILLKGDITCNIAYPKFSETDIEPEKCRYLFTFGDNRYFLTDGLEIEGYRYEEMRYLRPAHMTQKDLIYAGILGIQFSQWYNTRKFCGKCGSPMEHDTVERMVKCPSCGTLEYPKICPCVIVGVVNNGKILVSHYRNGSTNHYALLAGFAEAGETIEQCIEREVYEETHLKVKNVHYYKSQPWPYSSSLLFGFFCELDGSDKIKLEEDELAMARFVTPDEIYEDFNDYTLTNEMLCKFREDMKQYGSLQLNNY